MSPEAQRIAIAESVGIHLHDGDHAPSDYTFISDLPDYCNCLNAMQSAEDALSNSVFFDYIIELHKMVFLETATAAQRAEAYLKTIGKWEGTYDR